MIAEGVDFLFCRHQPCSKIVCLRFFASAAFATAAMTSPLLDVDTRTCPWHAAAAPWTSTVLQMKSLLQEPAVSIPYSNSLFRALEGCCLTMCLRLLISYVHGIRYIQMQTNKQFILQNPLNVLKDEWTLQHVCWVPHCYSLTCWILTCSQRVHPAGFYKMCSCLTCTLPSTLMTGQSKIKM